MRDARYHHARIRYFMDCFLSDLEVKALEVDCRCDRGHVYAWPLLLDGHHRFAGAILAKKRHINVEFGGRVDLREYLEGKRRTPPAP